MDLLEHLVRCLFGGGRHGHHEGHPAVNTDIVSTTMTTGITEATANITNGANLIRTLANSRAGTLASTD